MIAEIAALLGIAGAILVAKKDIRAFYFWVVANSLWIIYFKYSWAGLMFIVYLATSMYAINEWKTKEEKE